MTLLWKRRQMQREKTFRGEEQQRIRLKILAMEEVPEHLRGKTLQTESSQTSEDAMRIDDSPLPENFIMTKLGEPLEGEELFGDCQVPGYKDVLDYDVGCKPHIERPSKYPYM